MQTALLIFIVIFALAIGFFLGLFLLSIDAPFLKNLFQGEEEASSKKSSSPTLSPAADPDEVSAIKKPSADSQLLLQVWKEAGKAPVYEFKGVYVAKEKLPRELLHIISIQEENAPIPEPQPKPVSKEEPAVTSPDIEVDVEEEEEGELKLLSVGDEVNQILQHKLHGSPQAGKGIHLMENHDKEIRFWVGLNSYSDVSEIPDPEIQRMINEAVKEWEQSRD